jgi:uncharacterized SAM-binding protein YcdF (DUF218 family)
MEGEVAMRVSRCTDAKQCDLMVHSERGQSVTLFALLMPIMALFLIGVLDYMVTNARLMDTIAVADLSAHAGAQEVIVLPNGTLTVGSRGSAIAASYFNAQAPDQAVLTGASCGIHQGRPACWLQAQVRSAGYLLPKHWITVNAIGYLAHGVTHGDQ